VPINPAVLGPSFGPLPVLRVSLPLCKGCAAILLT
jgi:hypothetical protein